MMHERHQGVMSNALTAGAEPVITRVEIRVIVLRAKPFSKPSSQLHLTYSPGCVLPIGPSVPYHVFVCLV